jgi:L-ascorbate metabolism protein UlaG (beta-lactamase superfamily)
MRLTLVRHATLLLDYGGRRLLVDPMLDPAGARDPIEGTPNQVRNPLVELPMAPAAVVEGVDAVLVTHLHQDHFDDGAAAALPRDVPLVCQPEDVGRLRERGFGDLRPLAGGFDLDGIELARTGGEHGRGRLAELLAPVSGIVLRAPGEPVLYIAGDTVPCPALTDALARYAPDVVVVSGGGARFLEGEPIVMTAAEIVELGARIAPATVVAVHLEAINHCLERRPALHEAIAASGVGNVLVPADGDVHAF